MHGDPGSPAWGWRFEGPHGSVDVPTLLVEYDCTQGGANHVRTVCRDPDRDFRRGCTTAPPPSC